MTSASKIGKPFIFEKVFPMAVEKYITLHPSSKYQSKCYDYWNEVLELILPLLRERGISVVQIGAGGDASLTGCYNTQGQTDIGQVAYIVKNGLLHLGADSFPTHIAGSYDKKIVCIYSNTYANVVRPFWGNPDNQILIEPDRKDQKPSFCAQENPKTINSIKPEQIATAVCKLLEIPFKQEYQTVYFGDFYFNRLIESVPDSVINIQGLGIDTLIMRMDFLFNEDILAKQLSVCPCSINTDKPINQELLVNFRGNIREIVYILDENHKPEFVEFLHKNNFAYHLASYAEGAELEGMKVHFMDYRIINRKNNKIPDRPELKNKDLSKMFYKSNKFTLSKGKIYASRQDWELERSIGNFSHKPIPATNSDTFIKEMESFYLLDPILN